MYYLIVLIELIQLDNTLKKEVTYLFSINYQSREPIYEQLYNSVVRLISLGVLEPKQQLPPVRQLATQLSVNPNTIAKAYKNLERDGIIYSVVGKGSFISEMTNIVDTKKMEALKKLESSIKDAVETGVTKEEIYEIIEKIFKEKG